MDGGKEDEARAAHCAELVLRRRGEAARPRSPAARRLPRAVHSVIQLLAAGKGTVGKLALAFRAERMRSYGCALR